MGKSQVRFLVKLAKVWFSTANYYYGAIIKVEQLEINNL